MSLGEGEVIVHLPLPWTLEALPISMLHKLPPYTEEVSNHVCTGDALSFRLMEKTLDLEIALAVKNL